MELAVALLSGGKYSEMSENESGLKIALIVPRTGLMRANAKKEVAKPETPMERPQRAMAIPRHHLRLSLSVILPKYRPPKANGRV